MMLNHTQLRRSLFLSFFFIFGATSELAPAQDPYQLLRQPGEDFAQVVPGRTFLFRRIITRMNILKLSGGTSLRI